MTTWITAHFSLEEMIESETAARLGIDNTPDADIIRNLGYLCTDLEALRSTFGDNPLVVSSGYRCPELNEALHGSPHSAHLDGRAVDFTIRKYGSAQEVAWRIAQGHMPFDQLIFEGTWVHYAIPEIGKEPRREVLTAHFVRGQKPFYTRGIG